MLRGDDKYNISSSLEVTIRGVFGTTPNIYAGVFMRKKLTAKNL